MSGSNSPISSNVSSASITYTNNLTSPNIQTKKDTLSPQISETPTKEIVSKQLTQSGELFSVRNSNQEKIVNEDKKLANGFSNKTAMEDEPAVELEAIQANTFVYGEIERMETVELEASPAKTAVFGKNKSSPGEQIEIKSGGEPKILTQEEQIANSRTSSSIPLVKAENVVVKESRQDSKSNATVANKTNKVAQKEISKNQSTKKSKEDREKLPQSNIEKEPKEELRKQPKEKEKPLQNNTEEDEKETSLEPINSSGINQATKTSPPQKPPIDNTPGKKTILTTPPLSISESSELKTDTKMLEKQLSAVINKQKSELIDEYQAVQENVNKDLKDQIEKLSEKIKSVEKNLDNLTPEDIELDEEELKQLTKLIREEKLTLDQHKAKIKEIKDNKIKKLTPEQKQEIKEEKINNLNWLKQEKSKKEKKLNDLQNPKLLTETTILGFHNQLIAQKLDDAKFTLGTFYNELILAQNNLTKAKEELKEAKKKSAKDEIPKLEKKISELKIKIPKLEKKVESLNSLRQSTIDTQKFYLKNYITGLKLEHETGKIDKKNLRKKISEAKKATRKIIKRIKGERIDIKQKDFIFENPPKIPSSPQIGKAASSVHSGPTNKSVLEKGANSTVSVNMKDPGLKTNRLSENVKQYEIGTKYNHPNLVKMEKIEGKTLVQSVQSERISNENVTRLMEQAKDCCLYLFQNEVGWSDLNGNNIWVVEDKNQVDKPNLKLANFEMWRTISDPKERAAQLLLGAMQIVDNIRRLSGVEFNRRERESIMIPEKLFTQKDLIPGIMFPDIDFYSKLAWFSDFQKQIEHMDQGQIEKFLEKYFDEAIQNYINISKNKPQ